MKVTIIAEAGVNHNGNIVRARKLIDIAKNCNADYVKFQSFKVEDLLLKKTKKAEYQIRNTGNEDNQYEMLKKLELSEDSQIKLKKYCSKKDINFLSTAFEIKSLNFLKSIGLKTFKVPSGEITNTPYLQHLGAFKKNIILSTGMSNLKDIEYALNILTKKGTELNKITILHCTTDYPTMPRDVNLKAIKTIKDEFGTKVGYSDHTLGTDISIAAVAMGATLIEKHFTISRNDQGPDHKASLEPKELKELISKIRNIEIALGNGVKKAQKGELKNIKIARKSIVANQRINKNEIFNETNLTTKRPGTGITPKKWDKLIGKKSKKNYQEGAIINEKI